VPACVGHPRAQAKRLGDIEPPFLIDAERDRIGQQRLRGEELDLQARWSAKGSDGFLSLVRRWRDDGVVGFAGRSSARVVGPCGGQCDERQHQECANKQNGSGR
jgi:hypothetical protein